MGASYLDVSKGMCEKEFQAFKQCVQVSRLCLSIVLHNGRLTLCCRSFSNKWEGNGSHNMISSAPLVLQRSNLAHQASASYRIDLWEPSTAILAIGDETRVFAKSTPPL